MYGLFCPNLGLETTRNDDDNNNEEEEEEEELLHLFDKVTTVKRRKIQLQGLSDRLWQPMYTFDKVFASF